MKIYWLLFGSLFLSAFGLPIPEEAPLIAAGGAVKLGDALLIPVAFVALGSIVVGDFGAYLLGRKLGPHALRGRFLRRFVDESHVRRAKRMFRRHGNYAVGLARLFPGVRAVTFFTAGTLRFPLVRFLVIDTAMSIVSVTVWVGLGYLVGAAAQTWWKDNPEAVLVLVALGVLAIGGIVWWHRGHRRRRRLRRERIAEQLFGISDRLPEVTVDSERTVALPSPQRPVADTKEPPTARRNAPGPPTETHSAGAPEPS